MNISDESLKLLESVIKNNPKYSPIAHPNDYKRWMNFVLNNYKNKEYINSWDLYKYLMENGFEKFEDEASELVKNYQYTLEVISYLDRNSDNISLRFNE